MSLQLPNNRLPSAFLGRERGRCCRAGVLHSGHFLLPTSRPCLEQTEGCLATINHVPCGMFSCQRYIIWTNTICSFSESTCEHGLQTKQFWPYSMSLYQLLLTVVPLYQRVICRIPERQWQAFLCWRMKSAFCAIHSWNFFGSKGHHHSKMSFFRQYHCCILWLQ